MAAAANLVEVAALVGDTARATMLAALMGGQSLTGSELAFLAHISRPTASEHLSRLVQAGLLSVTKKRRFHYYRIGSPHVAQMLESMKGWRRYTSPLPTSRDRRATKRFFLLGPATTIWRVGSASRTRWSLKVTSIFPRTAAW